LGLSGTYFQETQGKFCGSLLA